ncbi:MAG: OmpA family protein [Pseudomonadota bacterium]
MHRKFLVAVSALALSAGLTACENVSNRTLGTTAGGAIVGAGLGTLAGGDDGRNAAIGAVVGALAGAAVGAYMDEQERKLREATAGTGIEVERQGDNIALNMPSDVTFPVNSAAVQPAFMPTLDDVANTLIEFPKTSVDIVGHASSDGPEDYNQQLSERRAASVQTYLVNRGMRSVRVQSYGFGETQPIASNDTAAGRAANRRVEVLLTPIVEEEPALAG